MLPFNIPLLGPSQAFAAAGLNDLGAGELGLLLRALGLAHLKHQKSRGGALETLRHGWHRGFPASLDMRWERSSSYSPAALWLLRFQHVKATNWLFK